VTDVGAQVEPRRLPDGSLQGPDGTVYRRTSVRLKRKMADRLIGAGAAIVTSVYPEGLRWYDGETAAKVWLQIRTRLIEAKRPPVRDLQWVGHVWESESGLTLLFFEGEH
jgi:hypothetical protein